MGLVTQAFIDPGGWQAERRIGGHQARQGTDRHPRIDRQKLASHRFARTHFDTLERDAVSRWFQFQVVADMHRWRQEADFLRELLADAFDTLQQFTALPFVDQRNQAIAHFQAERIDRHDVAPAGFFLFRRSSGGRIDRTRGRAAAQRCGFGNDTGSLLDQIRAASERARQQDEHHVRHARDESHAADDGCRDVQNFRLGKQLADQLGADVLVAGNARDHHTGCGRDDQRWNLCHQAVTDGQQRVVFQRVGHAHIVLHHADD